MEGKNKCGKGNETNGTEEKVSPEEKQLRKTNKRRFIGHRLDQVKKG